MMNANFKSEKRAHLDTSESDSSLISGDNRQSDALSKQLSLKQQRNVAAWDTPPENSPKSKPKEPSPKQLNQIIKLRSD